MRKDKATYIMAAVIIGLITLAIMLTNSNAQKDGQIRLLEEKLATAETVSEGLKSGIDKLIRYQECTAKILITPRDDKKAIQGNPEDPATALERCRIESNGEIISQPPRSQAAPQPSPQTQATPPQDTSQNKQGSTGSGEPPKNDEDDDPPEPSLIQQISDFIRGVL